MSGAAERNWLLFWLVLSSFWCMGAAQGLGATYDEPFYIKAGLNCWRQHNHRPLLSAGTMPLPIELSTLLLAIAERFFAANPLESLDTWMPVARLGTLVFGGCCWSPRLAWPAPGVVRSRAGWPSPWLPAS